MVHRSRLTHPNDRPRHGHTVKTDIMVREMARTDRRVSGRENERNRSDDRDRFHDEFKPTPEMVRVSIRRTAVVPRIESVPCDLHHAAAGEPCFRLSEVSRGVCGSRIINCAERVKLRARTR